MPRKIKLLQMMGAARAGGAETFFVRLMVALQRRKEVELLAVVRRGSWAAQRLAAAGVPFKEVGFGGMFDLLTAWRVRRMARDFRPDIVQGWMNRATRFVPKGPWARVARLGGYYGLKHYRGKVEYLIGNTQDICEHCVKGGWAKGKVVLLENFVPGLEGRAGKMPEVLTRVMAKAEEKSGVKRWVMMAARLHEVKGWDVLLEALAGLEGVGLLAVGEGPQGEALWEKAEASGVVNRVVWCGWQDDVKPFAAKADVWVVASRHEPLGNSVLDAWAQGVPVVATRTAGPGMLIKDGKTGLLVGIDVVAELGSAIGKVLQDKKLAAKLAENGKAAWAAGYSEEVVVGKVVDFYRKLAG